MIKLLYTITLIALLCVFYIYGLRPYFNALSETNRIITTAGIPLEKSNNKLFRSQTIKALKSHCQYNIIITDGIRCASNAYFKYFK